MKMFNKTAPFLIAALLIFSPLTFSEPVPSADMPTVPSKITQVTVFRDRALVTRNLSLTLSTGTYEVNVPNLPGSLEESSIHAKGKGTAKVKLFGARLVTNQLAEEQSPKVQELQEKIQQTQDKIQSLQHIKMGLGQKRKFLSSIQAASSDQIGKDLITKQPAVQDVKGLADYVETEMAASYEKDVEVDSQSRKLSQELDRLHREMGQLQGNALQTRKMIVDLECQKAGNFELEVSYRVPGASWEPVYEARTSSQSADLEFISYALIRQNTGEDWINARLKISTANPSAEGTLPEPQPWYLTRFTPPPPMPMPMVHRARHAKLAGMASMEMQADLAVASAPMAEPEMLQAEVPQASVESSGPAVQFILPKAETIASDWQPKKIAILTQSLPAEFDYEAVPRLSPHVYWKAKVTNNTEGVLLAGNVQIFVDEAFVGNSSIKLLGPQEKFDLSLGVDERIKLQHKRLKAKEDISVIPGVHGRMKSIDYEYLTTIENQKPTEILIRVVNQIPVSQNDEIKIEQINLNPAPSEEAGDKPGVKVWKLKVAKGAKSSIKSSYRVKFPVDYQVQGLEE